MALDLIQYAFGFLSGGISGFALGMFGGGGSILAVPLMVYLIGVPNPHLAIGTSAFSVVASAGAGLIAPARHGVVRWRCAAIYGAAGICGAVAGSTLGKEMDGQKLLLLFALLMVVVGVLMFRSRRDDGDPNAAELLRVRRHSFFWGTRPTRREQLRVISGRPSTGRGGKVLCPGNYAPQPVSRRCGAARAGAKRHALLRPVYDRFTEGFDTVDLKAAETLLGHL